MKWQDFDAIIFDLGGVVLNIDYNRTADAFIRLGIPNFDDLYSQAAQTDLFDRFETGKISAFHFINRLLDLLPKGYNANQVVHAWNAMILDFPPSRIGLLQEIHSNIPTFLLSNTNELHIAHFSRLYKETVAAPPFESLFNKIYYSSEAGLRKPDKEFFELVLEENGLNPERTLFIDDSAQHIAGAKLTGLQTLHLANGLDIHSLS